MRQQHEDSSVSPSFPLNVPLQATDFASASQTRPQMTASEGEKCNMGTTYYFAKPPQHQHGYTPQLRPRLVTQMQQFDALGRLQETVDLFSVGFLTSRLRKDIRSLTKEHHPPPNLIMTTEMIRAAEDKTTPGKHGPEATLAGAAAWEMHRGREIGAHGATFWTEGRCWKATRHGEGMYSITEDDPASETQWSWTRRTEVNAPQPSTLFFSSLRSWRY